jgi:hypothetical protein
MAWLSTSSVSRPKRLRKKERLSGRAYGPENRMSTFLEVVAVDRDSRVANSKASRTDLAVVSGAAEGSTSFPTLGGTVSLGGE